MELRKHNIPVEIDYRLTGAGWARCHVTIYSQHANTSASYLSDALGNLVRSVVSLKNGAEEATNSFDEEPGEYRWRFFCTEEELHLRILWFTSLWGNQPDEEGKVVFDAECSLDAFVQALVEALERLLQEHGIEGYKAKWYEHEFPMEEYNKLKA